MVAFWQVGELLVFVLKLPFPGSVLGMLLIWLVLQRGWLPRHWVSNATDLLTRHLSLFFIPPGVGLLQQWGLVSQNLWPIFLAAVPGSAVVLLVTAKVFEWQARRAELKGNRPSPR